MPDLSYLALSVAHFLLASLVLALCFASIKNRRSLLGITTAAFVLIDSIGLAFAPYYPIEDLPYAVRPFFEIRMHDKALYLTQLTAHWIFFFVVGAALMSELIQAPGGAVARLVRTDKARLIRGATLLTVIGSLAYIRYFAFGPGFERLISTRLIFDSVTAAVAHRMEAYASNGEGAYMAQLAANVAFPLAAMGFALARRTSPIVMFAALSLAYGYQTRQKAPLIAPLVTYTLIYIGSREKKKKKKLPLAKLSAVGAAIFGALIFLYTANFGLSVTQAVASNLIRGLLIPAATETNFFSTFPDTFGHRGLWRSLYIRMDNAAEDDVSVYQVAKSATGIEFSSNASFLAVGWSGLGYAGVLIVSLIVVGLLYSIDRMYTMNLPPIDHGTFIMLAGLCLAPAALGLTSNGVADFLTNGGFINPLIAYWLLRRDSVRVHRMVQHAVPRGVFGQQYRQA